MIFPTAICGLGLLAATVVAAPQPLDHSPRAGSSAASTVASIPQHDSSPHHRAAAVKQHAKGFIYGPSLVGEAAPFPNGTLGNARSQADMDLWQVDRSEIDNRTDADLAVLESAIAANGGLNSLEDYTRVLYDGQWKHANPRGTAPGILTNYTQDLLFSMERLSSNPFSLKLVDPSDKLPFEVDHEVTSKLAGKTLKGLQKSKSLFIVDYTWQADLEKTTVAPPRYGASCSAYFFIHPDTKDFLPLAIKTNTGSDLTYTPLDSPTDWLFAKMLFNVNDQFHAQMLHLVISHDVTESVHQAALHTLSERHPIMVVLDRLMLQAYSSRIVGEQLCFNPGGHWDQLLYINNVGCRQFVTDSWPTAGRYQAGYLRNDLHARGLIDEKGNFPFKTFPYFQDASKIEQAYRKFFTSLVNSYYSSDAVVVADHEVQHWFKEATEHAKTQDFPSGTVTKATLIDVLTHFAFATSVLHHSLNGAEPISSKGTLPFHLPALYAPLPAAKGLTDLLPFLPPAKDAVHYLGFEVSFNRPFYGGSDRALEDALDLTKLSAKLNPATGRAAKTFLGDMGALSKEVGARGFDENGLSQGMPFVYFALDPGYMPFFCAV